jgi:hypothetical protein
VIPLSRVYSPDITLNTPLEGCSHPEVAVSCVALAYACNDEIVCTKFLQQIRR